jgi:hypothetical protein
VVNVQLQRIGQTSEARDLDKLWLEEGPMFRLSGYIVDVIGMLTGVEDDVNLEVKQNILNQLKNNELFDG